MKATGWRGNTYGVRVGRANALKFFSRKWTTVDVEIGGTFHTIPLSPGFWEKCPELRSKVFGQWFKRKGLAPWPMRKPPRLELTPLGGNHFRPKDRKSTRLNSSHAL